MESVSFLCMSPITLSSLNFEKVSKVHFIFTLLFISIEMGGSWSWIWCMPNACKALSGIRYVPLRIIRQSLISTWKTDSLVVTHISLFLPCLLCPNVCMSLCSAGCPNPKTQSLKLFLDYFSWKKMTFIASPNYSYSIFDTLKWN